MIDKPHLSATQLDMFCRCPEAYRRRYLEKEKIPPGIAAVVGKGVHAGAEANFRQKIDTHVDLKPNEIVDIAVAASEREISSGVQLTAEEESRGPDAVVSETIDTVVEMATAFSLQQAPAYQPLEVERSTLIVLPECSHNLLAVTDLRDNESRVVDLKTTRKSKSQTEVDASVQLTIYAAAYRVDNGVDPSEVRLDTLVAKKRSIDRQVLSSTRSTDDYAALANRIDAVTRAIAAGTFIPADPLAWNCSPKWCGYYRTCPYVSKRKVESDE